MSGIFASPDLAVATFPQSSKLAGSLTASSFTAPFVTAMPAAAPAAEKRTPTGGAVPRGVSTVAVAATVALAVLAFL